MKNFSVQLNLDNDSRIFIRVMKNNSGNAIHHLQTNKWVKDEDTSIYYNMDRVISFSIYDENEVE